MYAVSTPCRWCTSLLVGALALGTGCSWPENAKTNTAEGRDEKVGGSAALRSWRGSAF